MAQFGDEVQPRWCPACRPALFPNAPSYTK
jgi:hypothetical protein